MKLIPKIFILIIILASCSSTSRGYRDVEFFEVNSISKGSYRGVAHFVKYGGELSPKEQDSLRPYVSYLLQYKGLVEVASEDEAELSIIVNYKDDSKEQVLMLTAYSINLYKALKEIRPMWQSTSRYAGRLQPSKYKLTKLALSLRDVVGANAIPEQRYFRLNPDNPVIENTFKYINDSRQ